MMIYIDTNKVKNFTVTMLEVPGNNFFLPANS